MYEISAESIGVLAAFHLYLKILASTATSAEDKHAISLQIHHLLDTSSPVALLEQDPPEPSPTVAVTPLFQHLVDTLEALCAVHTAAVINQSCDFIWDKLACTVQQIVRWIDFAHQTYSITPSLALTCPELVPVLTRLVYFIVVRLKPQLVPIVRQNPRLWTLAFELWLHYPAAYDPRASQRLTVLGGTAGCEIVDHMTTHVQNEPDIVDMLRTEFRRYVGGHHFQRRLLKLLALRFDPVDETVARHSWMYHHLRASMAVLLAVGGECAPISRRFFRAVIAVANETAQDVACGTRHGDLQFAETYLKLVIVSLCETICGVIDDSRSPRTIINAIQAGLVCFLMEHAPVFERFEEVFHADIAQIEDALAAQCCLPPALKVLHHHHADLLEDNTRSAEARRRFPRLMYAFKRHWAEYARFRTERLWAQSITCCNRSTDTHEEAHFKACPCKMVFYCSVACQRADWRARHRRVCVYGDQYYDGSLAVEDMFFLAHLARNVIRRDGASSRPAMARAKEQISEEQKLFLYVDMSLSVDDGQEFPWSLHVYDRADDITSPEVMIVYRSGRWRMERNPDVLYELDGVECSPDDRPMPPPAIL